MIFRTQDEIKRKLNKMEPPTNLKFNIDSLSIIQEDAMFHLSKNQYQQPRYIYISLSFTSLSTISYFTPFLKRY